MRKLLIRSARCLLIAAIAALAAGCREEGDVTVKAVKLEGVKAVDPGRVREVLATRKGSWLPWGEKRYFDRERLQADLKRIEAFYLERGFPDARVAQLDVQLNDRQDEARVTLRIEEGEPIRVESVAFDGLAPLPEDHFNELRNQVPLKAGEPLDRQLLQVSREMTLNELRDHGYPYAKVEAREQEVGPRRVNVRLAATPGKLARYGPIEVAGNKSVGDDVIRRHVTYKEGDIFRLTQLRATQRKLYGLELFEFANVEGLNEESEPDFIPTRITLAEGDHQQVTFGGGYGTEEKVRGQVEYRHVNLLGGARTGATRGKWSSLERGVRFDFTQPYFFNRNFSLGMNAQYWLAREPAYNLDTIGGRATVSNQLVRRGALSRDQTTMTFSASLIHEREEYGITKEALNDLSFRDELIALGLDVTRGEGKGTLGAIALDASLNTTDNLLDAARGYVASAHLEQAGRFMPGTFEYLELGAEGRYYLALTRRFVIATRARFSSIDGTAPGKVPFFKRYFLGGSTSLRGWGRYEVSPLSGSGLPIGGHTSLEMMAEARTALWGKLRGVVFLDAGNVWTNPWDVNFNDLRYAVGPGLRYQTPVGPVRFDVGWQLTPIEGLLVNGRPEKRRWRMHFSIGQAF